MYLSSRNHNSSVPKGSWGDYDLIQLLLQFSCEYSADRIIKTGPHLTKVIVKVTVAPCLWTAL